MIASPSAVIADKDKEKKLLGKKTKPQNEEDALSVEKKSIKNLINSLKNACKLGALEQVEDKILELSEINDFYGMEPEVAEAINFAITQHCFSDMLDDSHHKKTLNVLKGVCLASNEAANILDKCANNANAQKFVAKSIKNWIDYAYADLKMFKEKITDRIELKLRKILSKCSKNHNAQKFVAWAIADLASSNVAACTCAKCNQIPPPKEPPESFDPWTNPNDDDFDYTNNDYFEPDNTMFNGVKCIVECEGKTDLKNILTDCLDNKNAKKYIAIAIKKLTKQKYFDFFQDDLKIKIISEIGDMLEKCAEEEGAKPAVAAAIREITHSNYIDYLTESGADKIINLLDKCSNNVAALGDISSSIKALVLKFGEVCQNDSYDERIYAEDDDQSDSDDIFNINCLNPFNKKKTELTYLTYMVDTDSLNFPLEDKQENWEFSNNEIEINNLANTLDMLHNPDLFNNIYNNSAGDVKKSNDSNDNTKNIESNLNKDISVNHLAKIFDLLYICINNSNSTGYNCASSIEDLLRIKNFQDMVQNNCEIKNKIVKSLAKCWSLDTPAEPTHDIIEKNIINRYRKKFFSHSDIKEIKNDQKIAWSIEPEKPSFDIFTNDDEEEIEEITEKKSVNQNIDDKDSDL